MSLEGKVALITGASSGIGAAAARVLAAAGMSLLLTARRQGRLREAAARLDRAAFLAGDLEDPELPRRLVAAALEEFGRCDVVINNAGIIATGTIEQIDLQRAARMVRINVEAAYRVAYTALRHFKREGRGHLINTSSILGMTTRPAGGAYAGTKHAVEALSRALRLEVAGTGICVSCIEPGMVRTELHDHLPEHPAPGLGISKPLDPEDVARGMLFILEQPEHVLISNLVILPRESPL